MALNRITKMVQKANFMLCTFYRDKKIHNEISLYTHLNGNDNNKESKKCWQGCGKLKPSYIARGNIK